MRSYELTERGKIVLVVIIAMLMLALSALLMYKTFANSSAEAPQNNQNSQNSQTNQNQQSAGSLPQSANVPLETLIMKGRSSSNFIPCDALTSTVSPFSIISGKAAISAALS